MVDERELAVKKFGRGAEERRIGGIQAAFQAEFLIENIIDLTPIQRLDRAFEFRETGFVAGEIEAAAVDRGMVQVVDVGRMGEFAPVGTLDVETVKVQRGHHQVEIGTAAARILCQHQHPAAVHPLGDPDRGAGPAFDLDRHQHTLEQPVLGQVGQLTPVQPFIKGFHRGRGVFVQLRTVGADLLERVARGSLFFGFLREDLHDQIIILAVSGRERMRGFMDQRTPELQFFRQIVRMEIIVRGQIHPV